MEGRQKGVLLLRKIVTVAVLAGLVLAVGAGGWILTKDKSQKAQKISLKEQKRKMKAGRIWLIILCSKESIHR